MNAFQLAGTAIALGVILAGSSLATAGAAPDPAPAATETPGGAGLPADVSPSSRSRVPLITPDAAIIALGREGIGEHHVAPATFAAAQKLFGTEGVIDIVGVIGDDLMTGLVLTTFDQQLPAGTTSDLPMP